MARHREELIADFWRYYGDSPRMLHGRGATLHEVAAMAAHLPPDSAVRRAMNPHHEWTLARQLQVAQINDARRLAWLYVSAHSKRRPPEPTFIRFPWDEKPVADADVIKGDVFESPQEAADWYAARFPERAAEVHQMADRMTA